MSPTLDFLGALNVFLHLDKACFYTGPRSLTTAGDYNLTLTYVFVPSRAFFVTAYVSPAIGDHSLVVVG